MSAEPSAVVDTNVLLYSSDTASPYYFASRTLRDRGASGAFSLCLTHQVLLEYFAVATNAKRVAKPRSPEEVWVEIAKFNTAFAVLPPPVDLVDRLLDLRSRVAVKGAEIFDLVIAATALAAGVSHVYTYDSTVFARVPGITVKEP